MNVDKQVAMHAQKLNEALKNGNTEKAGRHYQAILELYGYDE